MKPFATFALLPIFTLLAACPAPVTVDDDDDATDEQPALYGPDNGWFHADAADVPANLQGTGYEQGDTPYNWTFVDQFGDEVELYQFYGSVVVLDVFAEWCGPCQQHAPEGETIWQDSRDRGVTILAMMQQVDNGDPPSSAADPKRWADRFGLTHPVIADSDNIANQFQVIGGGFPTYPVIGPDMTVILSDLWPPSQDYLTQVLEGIGYW